MNISVFISRRLAGKDKENFSAPILRLAVISMALGLAVMLIAVSVSTGFQRAIKTKVAGFEGHIRITKFDYNSSIELAPIRLNDSLIHTLKSLPALSSVHPFALKGGIIKAGSLIEGAVLKGVDAHYRRQFFNSCMVRGHFPALSDSLKSNEILISQDLARKINLDTGSAVLMYFINEKPRIRKFIVAGVYNSGFEEFDKRYIIGDIRHIQKLNGWSADMVSGYEVYLQHFAQIDAVNKIIYKNIGYDLKSDTIYQRYPMIMDWLNLLDTNVLFIVALMIVIAVITIISSLLILILEKTRLIGILKALGAGDSLIRRIFIYNAFYLIIRGLIIGNVLAITLLLIQKYAHIIPLDSASYYMNTVPVYLNWPAFLLINLFTVLITLAMLIWPSSLIAHIRPARAIRFD